MALVMDGNRRWARAQGMLPMRGHAEGVKTAKKVVEFCLKKGIRHVSLYTFSIENFKRTVQEKSFLFNLLAKELSKDGVIGGLSEKGVRIRFVGDRSLFPEVLRAHCDRVEKETAQNDTLTVNLLFCYGGRQEMVFSAKNIAQKVQDGTLKADDITEETVAQHMWTNGSPDPDVVVRTGAAQRLSNFLLFQAAYSELYFLDRMWPAVTDQDLEDVYQDFITKRQRRFGK